MNRTTQSYVDPGDCAGSSELWLWSQSLQFCSSSLFGMKSLREYGPGDHSCHTMWNCVWEPFSSTHFIWDSFPYCFPTAKANRGLLLSSLTLGESNWSLWSVEAISYSEYTVFLSPFATSFPVYKTLPGFSAAVIWEKSQLSHDGGRNCYFRVSDWSFGTFPEKERVQ